MTARRHVMEEAPDGYRAVLAMEMYVRGRVAPEVLEFVKLRASVLNQCAFCVDMHTTDALAAGIHPRRIAAVAAWPESPFFDPAERAALALTDALTRLDPHGVSDATWDAAVEHFGAAGAADLVLAIATINTWNRIAIATHVPPPPLK